MRVPYWGDKEYGIALYRGDCLLVLSHMEDDSVDSIVCDPPYGLKFMGKKWDYEIPSVEIWKECLRVLKPGGHLLSFAGARTQHRMMVNIEDAGFEIRDCLMWLYGSGFPKSLDVSKAIDKAAGVEREVVGSKLGQPGYSMAKNKADRVRYGQYTNAKVECSITAPATDDAQKWQGYGTALKPAYEPICLARKPFKGTVAKNVLEHGAGAINIDGCRVGTKKTDNIFAKNPHTKNKGENNIFGKYKGVDDNYNPIQGRWPANVILSHHPECECVGVKRVKSHNPDNKNLDEKVFLGQRKRGSVTYHADADGLETVEDWDCHPECPTRLLDEQSGESQSAIRQGDGANLDPSRKNWRTKRATGGFKDKGGASRFFKSFKTEIKTENEQQKSKKRVEIKANHRFFYCAKASKKERGEFNKHPTVKPLKLMQYLVRLVTPPGGKVLDPFLGSGTTALACINEGFNCIGTEKDFDSYQIAVRRLEAKILANRKAV